VFAQTGLRISRYQPHTAMAPHQHDEASMNIVVGGDFLERIRKDERTYTRGTAAKAERLLLKPDISICEIAQSCGFASHSHLCREFKAHFGVTPSEYRSRHR
jgi:AraC-like DNA-binding protein